MIFNFLFDVKKHLLLIFISLFSQVCSAQWLSRNGKNITNDLGDKVLLRGMGLGGWMIMEGYMMQTSDVANAQYQIKEKVTDLIGKEDTQSFFCAWLENHVTKEDIDSLKAWGFNSVRLPMHYNLFTLPIEDEPVQGEQTWLNKGFELTDRLIQWCKANEMYVILDLHAAPGGQGYDQGISDYDPSKPSLWESSLNQQKTVALWKKLAERYKNEPWVGGYDLINEPNWNIQGNLLLKKLYEEITIAIRSVDTRHMLIIEGNWFANDFTNLTPIWDQNMIYSPHKYWSINNRASIQWVLDIREQHDVPIYFGESGENSNVWFRDAIELFESNNIGWAWWPMKKLESIAGPLSIQKSKGYEDILNYWKGNGIKPSSTSVKTTLISLAQNAKIRDCKFQKDVIDAMFRQIKSDQTIPFKAHVIPGNIYASDYDMGRIGKAYFDSESANLQVSTGNFAAWNNGWQYRNDGVDIEICQDKINSNGFNVGWIAKGEWMQYSFKAEETGLFDIEVRIAANSDLGKFYLSTGNRSLSPTISVSSTGGWQNWKTIVIPNIVISPEDEYFQFHAVDEGFNLNSFKFISKGQITSTGGSTKKEDEISIYPNPSSGLGYLNLSNLENEKYTLKIYDSKGKLHKTTTFQNLVNQTIPLELKGKENGMYYLLLQNEKGTTWSKKWIIVN